MTGEDLLDQQILAHVQDELDSHRRSPVGDSPIEKLLYRALLMSTLTAVTEFTGLLVPRDKADLARMLKGELSDYLIVEPQSHVAGWRVDFLVHAWDFGRVTGKAQYRRLIVECDGHDFHERTKEQACRDRSRDRAAQLLGLSVLRFTGSEIHNNPLGCAKQITDWALMGW